MILWSVRKETDIRRGRHCVFLMHVHQVFVTKYRRQIFDHDATEKLRTYFSNVCADFEAELVEMDGEPDHVHLLINYPPKLAISSLVNSLKGVSGRLLRRDRPDIAVRYYYKGVLWSPGYFASSCGGAPISVIRQYIEQQQTPGQVENRALYPRPEGRGFYSALDKVMDSTTSIQPCSLAMSWPFNQRRSIFSAIIAHTS